MHECVLEINESQHLEDWGQQMSSNSLAWATEWAPASKSKIYLLSMCTYLLYVCVYVYDFGCLMILSYLSN